MLISLDAAFGSHLYLQSKPLPGIHFNHSVPSPSPYLFPSLFTQHNLILMHVHVELLEKSKTPGVLGLELLKLAISCIPIAFPSKISVSELVTMLAKFLIHLDKAIRDKASSILSQLMETRSDLRGQIVYGLAKFALSIPDSKNQITMIVLAKVYSSPPPYRNQSNINRILTLRTSFTFLFPQLINSFSSQQSHLLKQWAAIIKLPHMHSRPPSRGSEFGSAGGTPNSSNSNSNVSSPPSSSRLSSCHL